MVLDALEDLVVAEPVDEAFQELFETSSAKIDRVRGLKKTLLDGPVYLNALGAVLFPRPELLLGQ